MSCKPCSPKIKNENSKITLDWKKYPDICDEGFGNAKLCYFISCSESEFPIIDYVYEQKDEPNYESKTYNYYSSCNQLGIRNAKERGINYIIFYTKYHGFKKYFENRIFITGIFPISYEKLIENRMAYKSIDPIFLSIENSFELNDEIWKEWFDMKMPRDYRWNNTNLHYYNLFLKSNSIPLKKILKHFEKYQNQNELNSYISEIKNYKIKS
jgi:hypothetical protein